MSQNLLIVGITICILILDQISKIIIEKNFILERPFWLINRILSITYIKNTGIAWGLFINRNFYFIIPSIIFLIAFIVIISRIKNKRILLLLSSGFIMGGVLGNLFDRITRGYVVDFIDFHFWPVFNLADTFITIGGILFAFLLLYGKIEF